MQINIKNICDSVKNWIITNANNVGSNYNNLPAPFKNGYTYTYVFGSMVKGSLSIKITKENNSAHNQVDSSTVVNQFNSYMSNKGFNVNAGNTNLTASNMLYFINCIHSFITAKLVLAISDTNFGINNTNYNVTTDTSTNPGLRKAIIYDSVNVSYPSISTIPNDSNSTVTADSYNKYISNLQSNLASTLKSQHIKYTFGSLASSSSCSSSSCSSSCSAFIAHIN